MLDSRLTVTEIAEMVAAGYGDHYPSDRTLDMLKAAVRAGAEYSENIKTEIELD